MRVVGAGSYGPETLEQIVATQANVVVLDSVSPVLAGGRRNGFSSRGTSRCCGLFTQRCLCDGSGTHHSRGCHGRSSMSGGALRRAVSVGGAESAGEPAPQDEPWSEPPRAGIGRPDSAGLTNKEIASQLNLSEQTVKNHVHRMLRKVGAKDRLSIVEVCRNEGLSI